MISIVSSTLIRYDCEYKVTNSGVSCFVCVGSCISYGGFTDQFSGPQKLQEEYDKYLAFRQRHTSVTAHLRFIVKTPNYCCNIIYYLLKGREWAKVCVDLDREINTDCV